MKTLNYLFACTLCLGAFFFASCDNGSEPETPGEGGGTLPPVQTDRSKLVTSIIENKYTYIDFVYNTENRLISGGYNDKEYNDVYSYNISYSPFSFVVDYDDFKMETSEVKLNGNGYITYCKVYDPASNEYADIKCEYDGDHIVKYMHKAEGYSMDITNTWKDGNLTQMHVEIWDVDSPIFRTFNYTYTENSPINTGVYFPEWGYEEYLMLIGGFLGRPTAKIPVSVEVIKYHGNDLTQSVTEKIDISVSHDDKGRITEYYENGELERVYAYDGNQAVWPVQ